MTLAIIDKKTETIAARCQEGRSAQVGLRRLVSPAAAGWEDDAYRIVPIEITDPPFDPATQIRSDRPVVTVEVDRVTEVYSVRDKTQAEFDAEKASRLSDASSELDRTESILTAFALLVLDEFNAHAAALNAIRQAAADATSLADFRARMTALQPRPERTADQLKAAIRAKLS